MHRYLEWPEKLSGERLDCTIDMSSRLKAEEYIQSVTWKCDSPLVLESQRQDGALLTAVLSGGDPGRRHAVEVLATTNQGWFVGERVMLLMGYATICSKGVLISSLRKRIEYAARVRYR